jgi:cell division protein FtsW
MREGWRERATDIVRRHRPDYLIILYMGILMLIGLIVIYAIGPQRANLLNNSYGTDYSEGYFFLKQLVSLGLALVAFAVMANLPYQFIVKHGTKVLLLGLGLCLTLALASLAGLGIAEEVNGASRWFILGSLGTFQPAEVLKFGLLLFLAAFLGKRVVEGKVNDIKETLVPVGILGAVSLFFIVVLQSDLGTGIALTAIVFTMLFAAGLNKKILLATLGALVALGAIFILSAPHRMERVVTFLQGDNTSVEDGGSYHIEHAKIAIGSGGFTGVGIGNSVQASGYLPESNTDSVFAIMGETFGFIGLVAILSVFTALLMHLLKIMDHLVDQRLKLLVAGVFGWFGAHVILNIAAIIGVFPLTGITLPLLSFGGTSVVFIAAALGLVFQLSRYTVHSSRAKEATDENSGSGRRIGRTRYASRRGTQGN